MITIKIDSITPIRFPTENEKLGPNNSVLDPSIPKSLSKTSARHINVETNDGTAQGKINRDLKKPRPINFRFNKMARAIPNTICKAVQVNVQNNVLNKILIKSMSGSVSTSRYSSKGRYK